MADLKPGNLKAYRGNLSLDWYGKDYSIIQGGEGDNAPGMVPPPKLNWVNDEGSAFYLPQDDKKPVWIHRGDIRVHEARPLVHQKTYTANPQPGEETLGMDADQRFHLTETDAASFSPPTNLLIKGDNLLALNTLKKDYAGLVKCVYIDPPFNTDQAFEHYDDNLEHSIWLGLMRERLIRIRDLLSPEGTLFIHLDDNELGYLVALTDEVMGRSNRINIITFKQGSATGHKSINPGVVSTSNFILVYAKSKTDWHPNRLFTALEQRDKRYGQFISDSSRPFGEWQFQTLNSAFAESLGMPEKGIKKILGDDYEARISEFVLSHASSVIQLVRPDYDAVSSAAREMIDASKEQPEHVLKLERDNLSDMYFLGGQRIIFYKDKLKLIDGELVAGEPLTSIWDDILSNNLHNEGDTEFPKGKKPEALIKRCIDLSTSPGDLVLDSFGGSGTTGAVAHKMGRRWIMVEQGDHCDSHIVPRLKKVLSGEDQGGVSAAQSWKGGGSFSYFHLGDSLLKVDENGWADLNWAAGRSWLEGAILSAYDFLPARLDVGSLLGDSPTTGVRKVKGGAEVALVSLMAPGEPASREMLSRQEWDGLYAAARRLGHRVFLFTNRGLELAAEAKPDDLTVIRVPEALVTQD